MWEVIREAGAIDDTRMCSKGGLVACYFKTEAKFLLMWLRGIPLVVFAPAKRRAEEPSQQ